MYLFITFACFDKQHLSVGTKQVYTNAGLARSLSDAEMPSRIGNPTVETNIYFFWEASTNLACVGAPQVDPEIIGQTEYFWPSCTFPIPLNSVLLFW